MKRSDRGTTIEGAGVGVVETRAAGVVVGSERRSDRGTKREGVGAVGMTKEGAGMRGGEAAEEGSSAERGRQVGSIPTAVGEGMMMLVRLL